ncbi:class I adenylate-forming enzyme family protein [Streptomyces sp. NBC_00576]|uniref:class I adenylate-forming enzyme family protein n=1 Tax=Streptomyces sp. NBC_00576 TaxID=2903665 RepID=UPI002E814970|nr:class I adenylate-forming enzyme family protein [Streptomyces sp. NBC_00576]WUB72212.1 acyl--CoA ligase [Streptomyces sp. NBC_00576]
MIKLTDIRAHAARRPGHLAIVDGDVRLTWANLADKVARVASAIELRLPERRPARAVFVAENRWELVVAMAALSSLGIPCVGLDHTAGPRATSGALEQLRPTVVISTTTHRQILTEAGWPADRDVLDIRLDSDPPKGSPGVAFTDLLLAAPGEPQPVEQPFEAFSFTSGTSGIPKLVIRRTSFEARRFADLVDQYSFDEDDVHLVTVPLYHASGPGWARIFLTLGGTIVLGPYDNVGELIRLIQDEGVSTTLMVPPVLTRVVAHPASEHLHRTSRLHFVLSGGRHLNRWVVNSAWDRLGAVLHLYYGTTETGVNVMIGPEELHVAPCRSGRPMPGNTIAVLDPEDRPLPKGQRGRVAIASYQLMDTYAAAEPGFLTLDHGGRTQRFLLTGDSGFIDEAGRLELTGRNDGVSKAAGGKPLDVNIFGLENDLMDLPCVRETAVLRTRLPEVGEVLVVPFAAVAPERLESGRRAVEAACERRVPCLPAYVVPVEAIPFSPTGKVRAAQLLEMVLPLVRAAAAERATRLVPA